MIAPIVYTGAVQLLSHHVPDQGAPTWISRATWPSVTVECLCKSGNEKEPQLRLFCLIK